MTRVLASVLSTRDLPLAELHAARLDGELFAVDECFAPVDAVDSPALRGAALLSLAGPRAIAVLESALWVHGVLDAPPPVHHVRVQRQAKTRLPSSRRLSPGERQVPEGDLLVMGGMTVTVIARTMVDLLFADGFGPRRRHLVESVLGGDAQTLASCRRRIAEAGHLPGKRRALGRLAELSIDAPAGSLGPGAGGSGRRTV